MAYPVELGGRKGASPFLASVGESNAGPTLKVVKQSACRVWVLEGGVRACQLLDEDGPDVGETWGRAMVGVEAAWALEASAAL